MPIRRVSNCRAGTAEVQPVTSKVLTTLSLRRPSVSQGMSRREPLPGSRARMDEESGRECSRAVKAGAASRGACPGRVWVRSGPACRVGARLGVEAVGQAAAVDVEGLEDLADLAQRHAPVEGPEDDVEVFLA